MSRLQELITELCPDGVEYKALGEVGELTKGSGLQKKDFTEAGIGCIHYGQIHTRFGAYTSEVLSYVPEGLAKKLTIVHPGDVVVAVTSEDVSACCKAVAWVGNTDVVTGGHCVVIRHGIEPKYLSYCFQTKDFFNQKKKLAAGVKVVEMRTDKLARIRIPVPPIEVQREVVRILDEYTAAHDELVKQLGEEMALRELQFSTAFEELVCSVDTETVALDKLALMTYGYTAKAVEDGDIRIIRITDIGSDGYLLSDDPKFIMSTAESSLKELTYGDVVVARTGGSYGKTLLYREDRPSVYASFLIKLDFDEDLIDSEYYWFFSRSEIYWNQANSLVSTGGQPQFNANALKRVMVPLPSLDDQRQIIEAMRVVESSIKGLSETLSHESEYRNQQLTLIRNQLLSFPEKVA